eukprot:5621532-Pleurochrysis_carterae.AAC.1
MTSSESCYDGLLGQCRNCGDNGNCQCGWSMNGHNDLLPMDRRRRALYRASPKMFSRFFIS